MNRPDSNDPRSADPPTPVFGGDPPPLESRLRATRPRPARFGPDELATGISPLISASRSPSAAGQNRSTRSTTAWWCAIAASWLGGMVIGASAWQALRGGESRLETVSELGPPADRNASDADRATTTSPAGPDRNANPDGYRDRVPQPPGRLATSRLADSHAIDPHAIDLHQADWADIVVSGEPLRVRNARQPGPHRPGLRRPGPGTPRRHPVAPRPEPIEIDRRTTEPDDAGTVGRATPSAQDPATSAGGPLPQERPPLTPASYRGQLRQLLVPSAIERLEEPIRNGV